mgnify:CR=1 FL=1
MASEKKQSPRLDYLLAASSARMDRWRELNARALAWAAGARGERAAVEAALAEVLPLEDFFAYPGPRLLKTLADRVAADDAYGAIATTAATGKRPTTPPITCPTAFRSRLAASRTGPISRRCSSRPGRLPSVPASRRKSAACGATRTR